MSHSRISRKTKLPSQTQSSSLINRGLQCPITTYTLTNVQNPYPKNDLSSAGPLIVFVQTLACGRQK